MSRAFTKERDDEPEPALVPRPRRKEAPEPVPPADHAVVGFGATVVVQGVGPKPQTFTVVEADHTDLSGGRIGIDSPLVEALAGHRAGETVVWHRPVGDRKLKIVSVEYH